MHSSTSQKGEMAQKAFWPHGKGFCHAEAWGLVATTKPFPTLARRE